MTESTILHCKTNPSKVREKVDKLCYLLMWLENNRSLYVGLPENNSNIPAESFLRLHSKKKYVSRERQKTFTENDDKSEAPTFPDTTAINSSKNYFPSSCIPFCKSQVDSQTRNKKAEYLDLYLCEELLPLVHSGLVALCRLREQLVNDVDCKRFGEYFHNRFCPVNWLGQYLFRHHPDHQGALSLPKLTTKDSFLSLMKTQNEIGLEKDFQSDRLQPFYCYLKYLVDQERQRREFILAKEEVKIVFEKYKLDNGKDFINIDDVANILRSVIKNWNFDEYIMRQLDKFIDHNTNFCSKEHPVELFVQENENISFEEFWKFLKKHCECFDYEQVKTFFDTQDFIWEAINKHND